MTAPDLSEFMMPPDSADLTFHTGEVRGWDSVSGTNTIRVLGTDFTNLPVLSSAGQVSLETGTVVGVLRYKTSLFVLGRVVLPGSGLAQPQQLIPLYPQFAPVLPTSGGGGYTTVNAGSLHTWEGRARPTQPYIEIEGIWGMAGGTGSITYAVKLAGQTYGQATYTTGPVVERLGPFDVRDRIGQDWVRVEVAITASSGTGQRAFQVLGAYFRQQ